MSVSTWVQFFDDGGFFMWPLLACAILGLIVIVWKFFSLTSTSGQTHKLLEDVDGLIANHRLEEAKARCRESDTPVAHILLAGLEKHDQGAERVLAAIENEGMIQMSRLERGLVWLAPVANVANERAHASKHDEATRENVASPFASMSTCRWYRSWGQ